MKNKILFFLIALSSISALAQDPYIIPAGRKDQVTKVKGGFAIDSVLTVPVRDHNEGLYHQIDSIGRILVDKNTHKFMYHNGTQYVEPGSGGGGTGGRFGIEDNTSDVDRSIEFDGYNLAFENLGALSIKGGVVTEYSQWNTSYMTFYPTNPGIPGLDGKSIFIYTSNVPYPETITVNVNVDDEESQDYIYNKEDFDGTTIYTHHEFIGTTIFVAYAYLPKVKSADLKFNLRDDGELYNGEKVVYQDNQGNLRTVTNTFNDLENVTGKGNTVTDKGIRIINSGGLNIDLGVYPNPYDISIYDPSDTTLQKTSYKRNGIKYTRNDGDLAYSVNFNVNYPSVGDGIEKTAMFRNLSGTVAYLSDIYSLGYKDTHLTNSTYTLDISNVEGLENYLTYDGTVGATWKFGDIVALKGRAITVINTSAYAIKLQDISNLSRIYHLGSLVDFFNLDPGKIARLYSNGVYWIQTN